MRWTIVCLLVLPLCVQAQKKELFTVIDAAAIIKARTPGSSTRAKMLELNGGTEETEKAAKAGIAWLQTQQAADGSWQFDGQTKQDKATATAMALLTMLGDGVPLGKDAKLIKSFDNGMKFLVSKQLANGSFNGCMTMYANAICTLALIEAAMITKKENFRAAAQKSVTYIIKAQGSDGSWGYKANQDGDTSITGWQIQALSAAKIAKFTVPNDVYTKAQKFLDSVETKNHDGYVYRVGSQPSPNITSVGFLSRYFMGWQPNHDNMKIGLDKVGKNMPTISAFDSYFLYYSAMLLNYAGDDMQWKKTWNPKMQEQLLKLQNKGNGSWPKDGGFIGASCGEIGTTALTVLSLQVYYRYPPLYKLERE